MLMMIGFVLFMTPITGVALYGIKRLIEDIGKIATVILAISLPFYGISISSLFGSLMRMFKDIANHSNIVSSWSISSFEMFSIICFIMLLIVSCLFAQAYKKTKRK